MDISNLGKYNEAFIRLQNDSITEYIELTPADIETLHSLMIETYGGINGIRDKNLFDSVCQNPYQEVFGKQLYPTIFDKAAKYLFDFCNYQVFLDGNKRTGVASMQVFLNTNHYDLTLSNEQVYNLAMDIANGQIKEISDISIYLKNNSIFYNPKREDIKYETESRINKFDQSEEWECDR